LETKVSNATAEPQYWREPGEIYALGALDGQALKDFEAHLAAGCPVCDGLSRETGATLISFTARYNRDSFDGGEGPNS